jgi:hypothetical protein
MAINDSTNRLAGLATISVGGVSYLLQGDLEWSCFDYKRESLSGMDRVHGFKEEPVPNFIMGTFRDTNKLSLRDFNGMTSVNISVALANGKTLIGSNMWCTSAGEVKSAEATFDLRFEGFQGSVVEN